MLKEVAKSVMSAVANVSLNEFKLLLSGVLTVDKKGDNDKPIMMSIKDCGFSIRTALNGEDPVIIKFGKFEKYIKDFRIGNISKTKDQLIGMELKRGCQYNREWIKDILMEGDTGELIVQSTSGATFKADRIRVYNSEDTMCSLYDFSAHLLISDGAVLGEVGDG